MLFVPKRRRSGGSKRDPRGPSAARGAIKSDRAPTVRGVRGASNPGARECGPTRAAPGRVQRGGNEIGSRAPTC
jgi:hypothetical protein